MNNPKFYIYGVPDGFNMLSGTADEILYYQLFYDTTKKGREMIINRKANGETVYSYLIYNLVACKGRAGAFLGLSIAFTDNEYCNNPVALKELFEGVYNKVILRADDKDKLIAVIDGDNAVGRFCITKFDERKELCEKIGRIIVNNVVGELSNSISTIDSSFDNSKEGRILTLPLEADNISISQALRSYTWVSLSSECNALPITSQQNKAQKPSVHNSILPITINQDLLSVHFINELTKKVGNYKDFIIQGLKGLVSFSEIAGKREEINHHLDTIEEYVGRQPELTKLKDDYMSIYKELVDLKPQQQNISSQAVSSPYPHVNEEKDEKVGSIHTYLTKIIVCLCAMLVIAVIIMLWPSDEVQPSTSMEKEKVEDVAEEMESGVDDASKAFDKEHFNSLLGSADYKTAWSMLQKIDDVEKKKSLALVLQNSYRDWFNNELEKRKNNLKGLLELKQMIDVYADFNEDNDRHNLLLDEYINPLKEQIAKKERERQEKLAQQERERQEYLTPGREQKKIGGSGEVTGTRSGVIKIYKASRSNYERGEQITVPNGKIKCKNGDCFVAEGATLTSCEKGIEAAVQKDGVIRIRAPRVGKFKVKLNQVDYTFQVEAK